MGNLPVAWCSAVDPSCSPFSGFCWAPVPWCGAAHEEELLLSIGTAQSSGCGTVSCSPRWQAGMLTGQPQAVSPEQPQAVSPASLATQRRGAGGTRQLFPDVASISSVEDKEGLVPSLDEDVIFWGVYTLLL